jgi:hypothetical protein
VRWLLDEMLPPAAGARLVALGHDAISVVESELAGSGDRDLIHVATQAGRVLMTENFRDFAMLMEERLGRGEPCSPILFVRKGNLPRGPAMAAELAARLHHWAAAHPEPDAGPHWL